MQDTNKGFGAMWRRVIHPGEVWTGLLVWLIIAGVCVLVANVIAAGF